MIIRIVEEFDVIFEGPDRITGCDILGCVCIRHEEFGGVDRGEGLEEKIEERN